MASQSNSSRPKLLLGTFVDTPEPAQLRCRPNLAIGVDASGTIAFIEDGVDANGAAAVLEKHGWPADTDLTVAAGTAAAGTAAAEPAFFFPGFLDTHTHAPQYPNVGVFGSSTLLDWLETYTFPMEAKFQDPALAARVYGRVVARLLANGTTAAAYYATVHVPATNLLADICLARGQRALIGRVCMDRMSPDFYRDESAESAVADTRAVMAHISGIDPAGALVRPVITPRFAISCTEQCLAQLGALHKETGCWAQTHISENKNEIALVKELFPKSRDYASVYDEFGLLTDKMILAHAVHLTPDEIDLVRQRKTKISHCPASNTSLTSGAMKIKALMASGVDMSLGTDMSGGFSPSILEMVRQAALVSRHVAMNDGEDAKLSVSEALWLGTVGGARAMGLEAKVGVFEVGKEFDAQLIALDLVADAGPLDAPAPLPAGPVDIFGWEPLENVVAKWVYNGDDRNVAGVWVKGRLVHQTPRFPNSA